MSLTIPTRRAFTVLELMLVLIVIAIIAAITVPRFASTERRAFELAVEQTADLLTVFAQRDRLSSRPIALWHDTTADHNWLTLLQLDKEGGSADERTDWREDPFVSPVKFPATLDSDSVEIVADGERIDARQWPLVNWPGHDRPTIQIFLHGEDHSASLYLSAHAVVPRRVDSRQDADAIRLPVDLDGTGRTREDW